MGTLKGCESSNKGEGVELRHSSSIRGRVEWHEISLNTCTGRLKGHESSISGGHKSITVIQGGRAGEYDFNRE